VTTKFIQSAILSLALVAGSAGLAQAQGTSTPGAPAGSNTGGNGATGSGAAPSGK
jgi:hypothetical protein